MWIKTLGNYNPPTCLLASTRLNTSLLKKEKMEKCRRREKKSFILTGKKNAFRLYGIIQKKKNVNMFGIFNRIQENTGFIKQREL